MPEPNVVLTITGAAIVVLCLMCLFGLLVKVINALTSALQSALADLSVISQGRALPSFPNRPNAPDDLKSPTTVLIPKPPVLIPQPGEIVAPRPAGAPTPSVAFPGAPSWFNWAAHEIGTRDESGHTGAAIARYIQLAHTGAQGDPWCAIFANAALEAVGITGTRSASSQSFKTNPNFVQLSGPALGAIAVFWRNFKNSGLGHVGFYRGELQGSLWILGGNEGSMVQIEALPKDSATFGLIGYYWPKTVPLPQTGAIIMPQGSSPHVQTPPEPEPTATTPPGRSEMTSITATMFGGTADPNTSAYDGHVIDDTELGVALPYHFTGSRPKVKVTNPKTGATATGDIVDVGPWYPNQGKQWAADPYWQSAARPRAESDTNTNHAGIDLTPAMAKAVGIEGKGEVNWQFVS